MKKIVSVIALILTICVMISLTLVPAFAVRTDSAPQATRNLQDEDATISSQIIPEKAEALSNNLRGATINETNPTTYIIVAIGIFVVAMGLGILIGYNIKKKNPIFAEEPEETE